MTFLPRPCPCFPAHRLTTSATEMLDKDDKFFCDHCCCLQEAQKRLLIKQAPACLILHLKRFKYVEAQGK